MPPCSPVVIEAGAILGGGRICCLARALPAAAGLRRAPWSAAAARRPRRRHRRSPRRSRRSPCCAPSNACGPNRSRPCNSKSPVCAPPSCCAPAAARGFSFRRAGVRNDGVIALGDFAGFRDGMIATELVCHEGARISIGARSYFNYGAFIEAHKSVTIGARCMIASMTRLVDRSDGASGPIAIGDDVWIAHGAVIAAGVSIGAGSVVSAGSVVTADAPPNSLVSATPPAA